MADTSSCTGIISNPDLAGIGTRLNFYITILLTVLIPQNKYTTEVLDSLYLGAVFYGLALLITALVQTIQRQLDLYHAIIVMHMIIFLQFLHGFGLRRYISARSRFKTELTVVLTIVIQVLSLLILYPWSFYMWIDVSRFGAQPECNHLVKFVLVFYTFRATVVWTRVLCMIILALSAFAQLYNLIFITRKRGQSPDAESDTGEKVKEPANDNEGWIKRIWKRLNKHPIIIQWVSSVLSAVVGVANTELTIRRNNSNVQAGEGAWGFGQIVSLVLILPSIIEIVAILDKPVESEEAE